MVPESAVPELMAPGDDVSGWSGPAFPGREFCQKNNGEKSVKSVKIMFLHR